MPVLLAAMLSMSAAGEVATFVALGPGFDQAGTSGLRWSGAPALELSGVYRDVEGPEWANGRRGVSLGAVGRVFSRPAVRRFENVSIARDHFGGELAVELGYALFKNGSTRGLLLSTLGATAGGGTVVRSASDGSSSSSANFSIGPRGTLGFELKLWAVAVRVELCLGWDNLGVHVQSLVGLGLVF